jgi:mannose-6-phosphate isomerase-like protein (cupin superfamily)
MSNHHAADKSAPSPPVFVDGRGGSITILEEGSATTPMRYRMVLPQGFGPPAECHPSQAEDFRIISGVFDLGYVSGKRVELRAGQKFTLPAGTLHRPHNYQSAPAEFEASLTPGLTSAAMFRSIYSTARTQRGLGLALRMALIMDRHRAEIGFTLPVRLSLRLLGRLARLVGVRAD